MGKHQSKIIEWMEAEISPIAIHYSEVARKLNIGEQECNTEMNRLFRQGVLRKPQAGRFVLDSVPVHLNDNPEDDQDPWDMSGATVDQVHYAAQVLESLNLKFPRLDTTVARAVLRKLNEARRIAGIPFEEYH